MKAILLACVTLAIGVATVNGGGEAPVRPVAHGDVPELEGEFPVKPGEVSEALLDDTLELTGCTVYHIVNTDQAVINWGAAFLAEHTYGLGAPWACADFTEARIAGDTLSTGIYWIPEGLDITLPDGSFMVLEAGLVIAGNVDVPCEVWCRDGFYACCGVDRTNKPFCKCREDGVRDQDCSSGGAGSVSCSVGTKGSHPMIGHMDEQ
ncbi:MAG: hypothetical protein KDA21_01435 [Phycisphaerales bacterium]|nr:hypothetical protein [Phycisphaerales bacterium]